MTACSRNVGKSRLKELETVIQLERDGLVHNALDEVDESFVVLKNGGESCCDA